MADKLISNAITNLLETVFSNGNNENDEKDEHKEEIKFQAFPTVLEIFQESDELYRALGVDVIIKIWTFLNLDEYQKLCFNLNRFHRTEIYPKALKNIMEKQYYNKYPINTVFEKFMIYGLRKWTLQTQLIVENTWNHWLGVFAENRYDLTQFGDIFRKDSYFDFEKRIYGCNFGRFMKGRDKLLMQFLEAHNIPVLCKFIVYDDEEDRLYMGHNPIKLECDGIKELHNIERKEIIRTGYNSRNLSYWDMNYGNAPEIMEYPFYGCGLKITGDKSKPVGWTYLYGSDRSKVIKPYYLAFIIKSKAQVFSINSLMDQFILGPKLLSCIQFNPGVNRIFTNAMKQSRK